MDGYRAAEDEDVSQTARPESAYSYWNQLILGGIHDRSDIGTGALR